MIEDVFTVAFQRSRKTLMAQGKMLKKVSRLAGIPKRCPTSRTAPITLQACDEFNVLVQPHPIPLSVSRMSCGDTMENERGVVDFSSLQVHAALMNDQLRVKDLQRMYLTDHGPFFAENGSGQNVLHLAAQLAVAPDILLQLVLLYPDGCAKVDHYGRYPLRYLSCHLRDICDKFGHFGRECCEDIISRVIYLMYRAHPDAITELDLRGQSPVDSAITNGAPSKFIKIFQNLQDSFRCTINKKNQLLIDEARA